MRCLRDQSCDCRDFAATKLVSPSVAEQSHLNILLRRSTNGIVRMNSITGEFVTADGQMPKKLDGSTGSAKAQEVEELKGLWGQSNESKVMHESVRQWPRR
jgi:hypothetical protein